MSKEEVRELLDKITFLIKTHQITPEEIITAIELATQDGLYPEGFEFQIVVGGSEELTQMLCRKFAELGGYEYKYPIKFVKKNGKFIRI